VLVISAFADYQPDGDNNFSNYVSLPKKDKYMHPTGKKGNAEPWLEVKNELQ
jgi:hypothetical protein